MKRITLAAVVTMMMSSANAQQVAVGQHHTVIESNGSVFATGYNRFGEFCTTPVAKLGDSTTQYTQIPVYNVTDVSATAFRTALITNGKLKVCGRFATTVPSLTQTIKRVEIGADFVAVITDNDQLLVSGLGNTTWHTMTNDLVDNIEAGSNHLVVLTKYGEVYTYGTNNTYGQLGHDATTYKVNISNIKYVAAGHNNTFAIDQNDGVYAWGNNNYGQLGNGNKVNQNLPVKLKITGIDTIKSGNINTLFYNNVGEVYATGFHDLAKYNLASVKPIRINELTNFDDIGVGVDNTVVLDNDLSYVFGGNMYGKLGTGDNIERNDITTINVPVGVVDKGTLKCDLSTQYDCNNGHGNDPGKYDPSNPGKSKK